MLTMQQQPIHKVAQNVIVTVLVMAVIRQLQVIVVAQRVHQVTALVVQVPLMRQHQYLHQHVAGAAVANFICQHLLLFSYRSLPQEHRHSF
jgi:hypothetical protein